LAFFSLLITGVTPNVKSGAPSNTNPFTFVVLGPTSPPAPVNLVLKSPPPNLFPCAADLITNSALGVLGNPGPTWLSKFSIPSNPTLSNPSVDASV